ncbi:MAG: DUF1643 domain-containing protein [Phycisphaerales bacterium JB039]
MAPICRTATLSPCRRWRYALGRRWGEGPPVVFIGLNPSTADETVDDPTCRRAMGFARAWGFGACAMVNLFALRTTDPRVLRRAADPVGPEADGWILRAVDGAPLVIAAWGAHGALRGRAGQVLDLLGDRRLHCLGRTKSGQPRHILYLRADARRRVFQPRQSRKGRNAEVAEVAE